jgi:hypothetical protein
MSDQLLLAVNSVTTILLLVVVASLSLKVQRLDREIAQMRIDKMLGR